ncbi:MAG TPA: site-specific DNA-methyltransferase [Conexivisphaerales archaeon]|nr:site-specific DNA-methyltransferase [Conexivisphaerales archaeon]
MKDSSVQLVVTSPPYPMIEMWDSLFGQMNPQIAELLQGATSSDGGADDAVASAYELMHKSLAGVWRECHRVLTDGGIACINIGDATRTLNGKFRLFPNHATVIERCEEVGFVTLPFIVWKKPTNKPNAFLGSGFLPTNGYVTLDLEHILIFRKGDIRRFPPKDTKRYSSSFTKAQRDVWFSQVWSVRGATQSLRMGRRRSAAFPDEIPNRLIRMFSVVGDTVLDPFLGTGTTMKVAGDLDRNSVGFEVDRAMGPTICDKLGRPSATHSDGFEFKRRS